MSSPATEIGTPDPGVPIVDITALVQGLHTEAEACRERAVAAEAVVTTWRNQADYLDMIASVLAGPDTGTEPESDAVEIIRIDRYHIAVDGYVVLANDHQERAVQNMTPTQRADFLRVMGRTASPAGGTDV